MITLKYIRNESGIALVIALVMLLALTVIGISSMMTTTLDTQISGNERRAAEALNLADAGMERGVMDLLVDFSMDNGDSDWSNANFYRLSGGELETITLDSDPTDNYGTYPPTNDMWGDPFGSGLLNGANIGNSVDIYDGPVEYPAGSGDYYRVLLLRESGTLDQIYVRSYALHHTGAKKILQVHIDVDAVDAWRNAIFAGRGSGTDVISGNLTVGGSIHILGTGEEDVVFAVSGSAEMVNGYKGLDADVKNRIPDSYIAQTDGGLETLEAVMRVKRGKVHVAGSANLGEEGGAGALPEGVAEDAAGDQYKSNLDAIYTNDGFATTADGYPQNSAMDHVYADNYEYDASNISYESESYDLGDKVQMPEFNDDYDGQTDRAGGTCSDCPKYEDYVEEMSVLADLDGDPLTTGDKICDLKPTTPSGGAGTPAFCIGCDSGGNCGEPTAACKANWTADCGDRNGCIKWDPAVNDAGLLQVDGRVKLPDSCSSNIIGASGKPINYKGKGILYSTKDVNVKGNVLSSTANMPDAQPGKFVEDHLLAFMSKNDMTMDAGMSMMGAFYAVGNITAGNNTKIVGSMMSNSFNMPGGAGSASVYYVNNLSDELYKMGMIRSGTVYTFKKYEWEEKF